MKLNRVQNAKRNIVWGLVLKIINVILPFFLRTIIIYNLGIGYVGLNSLFTSILSTLSLAELGFDSGIVTIMYDSVAKDDKENLSKLLRFIKKAYFFVGIIILVAGLICLPFLKYFVNDINAVPNDINIYILFSLFLINTVISYFFGGFKLCLLEAYQRQDIVTYALTYLHLNSNYVIIDMEDDLYGYKYRRINKTFTRRIQRSKF